MSKRLLRGVLLAAVGACSSPPPPEPAEPASVQAPPIEAGETKMAAEYLQEPRFADANLERGRVLGLACAACHTFGAGEKHNLGPNLHGFLGRRAGTAEGFAYSAAMRASGIVWTPDALLAWLAQPSGFIEGNNMAFAGFSSPGDRQDLVAYLLVVTEQ